MRESSWYLGMGLDIGEQQKPAEEPLKSYASLLINPVKRHWSELALSTSFYGAISLQWPASHLFPCPPSKYHKK
jgi:hypothetical protein